MTLRINSAINVKFYGDRHIHAHVAHNFSSEALGLVLSARAHQFSSFVLMLGRLGAQNTFEPKSVMIVQNKGPLWLWLRLQDTDDLSIPLLLDTIPSPQEFQDAIESLSPDQKRFRTRLFCLT